MDKRYGLYIATGSLLFLFFLPTFWLYGWITGRYTRHLRERLGIIPRSRLGSLSGSPRFWVHAASLGEVKVASAFIQSLRRRLPGCNVVLSTVTEHGRELAREIFENDIPLIYAPLDFIGSVRGALRRIRPDVLVFIETEIWPAWTYEARRMGIRLALVNGRLSSKSLRGYLRFRSFFRRVLEKFDTLSMISSPDARRITSLGAEARKVRVNGNAKYDLLPETTDPRVGERMRVRLGLGRSERVFLAGSTRSGEERQLLDAYETIRRRFPDTILVLAPRHLARIPGIVSELKNRGNACERITRLDRGQPRRHRIVLVDTYGELFDLYSAADLVFCGGSLLPFGGQNPLEPAVWGKPVLYGPYMENFLEAKNALEAAGAGTEVHSAEELSEAVIVLMQAPEDRSERGERARHAALSCRGAADRHARAVAEMLRE